MLSTDFQGRVHINHCELVERDRERKKRWKKDLVCSINAWLEYYQNEKTIESRKISVLKPNVVRHLEEPYHKEKHQQEEGGCKSTKRKHRECQGGRGSIPGTCSSLVGTFVEAPLKS